MLRATIPLLLLLISGASAQEDPLQAGDAAYRNGDYESARVAFTGAWEAAQQTPDENPDRYAILKRLASVRAAAGEFGDADEWLEQAIAWRYRFMGPNDPKIAGDLLISVGLSRAQKHFDRALGILERVQRMHVQQFTRSSVQVADDLSRVALVHAEDKNLDAAVAASQTALEIREALTGPLDPSLIADLDRLGEYQTTLRAYAEAESAYRRGLVIRETLYGKHHADLIATVDGLAYALFGQKKYDAAEPLYRRLLDLWEDSVGKDHPMVAIALDKIAVFYVNCRKYPEANAALARSTAIRGRFLAQGFSQQATEAFAEGRKDQAKIFYRRGLTALDPPDAMNDDLREQFKGMLLALDAPAKPAPSVKKPAPPQKKSAIE